MMVDEIDEALTRSDPRPWLDGDPPEADVAFYEAHGWVITPQLLPDELLDDALYGVERLHAGERDSVLPLGGGYLDWRREHGETMRLNDYVSLQVRELAELVHFPAIARIAARLSRSSVVRLFHDQLVAKPPHIDGPETVVGWHTDRAYWKTCTSRKLLTAWIPLQDCTLEMGPLTVIDGSHRWADTGAMTTFVDRDLEETERRFFPSDQPARRVPFLLRRGQMSFHHCDTVHGSLPNRSDRDRIALTIHFQDGDNEYVEHTNCRGQRSLHLNDLLCRKREDGSPDYADPEICPILWSEQV